MKMENVGKYRNTVIAFLLAMIASPLVQAGVYTVGALEKYRYPADIPDFGTDLALINYKVNIENYAVGLWSTFSRGNVGDQVEWKYEGPVTTGTVTMQYVQTTVGKGKNQETIECWLTESGVCSNVDYYSRHISQLISNLSEADVGSWLFTLSYNGSPHTTIPFEVVVDDLVMTGGNNQTGQVLEPLSIPFEARVFDHNGDPKPNELVRFEITSQPRNPATPPTIQDQNANSIPSTVYDYSHTDEYGFARALLTLGSEPGEYRVTATSESAKFDVLVYTATTAIDPAILDAKELGLPPCDDSGKACESGGNPINFAIGNKYQHEVDIPNIAPSLLEFSRTYNSKAQGSGDMGWNWQHNYERAITTVETGKGKSKTTTAYIQRRDGKSFTFVENDGVFTTDPDVHAKLIADQNGWVYTEDNTIEKYDTSGRLVSLTYLGGKGAVSPDNPDSRTVTLSYNLLEQLHTVTDDVGSSLTFTYDILGRVETITDQAMRTWTYVYDIGNKLTSVVNPDQTTRQYHYEDVLNNTRGLTGITDERDIRYATFAYDIDGMAISSYHAGNVDRVDVTYDDESTRTVTNSRGGMTTYRVTGQHDSALITSIDGFGCSTCAEPKSSFKYDGENNKVEQVIHGVKTQYRGHGGTKYPRDVIVGAGTPEETTTTIFYDSRFNGLETQVYGESIYPHRHPFNTVIPHTTLTEKVYDEAGNLLSITESGYAPDSAPLASDGVALAPRVTTFAYDGPLGQVSRIDGPRTDVSDVTLFEYYPNIQTEGNNRGRLKRVVYALGQVIRDNITYTATGKVSSETRLNGLVVTNTYYAGSDRLESMTESNGPDSVTTHWTYLPSGEVKTTTTGHGSADASTVTFDYDDARRLIRVSDGLGNYRSFVLDTEGNVTDESTRDASGTLHRQLVKIFDAYSRIESASQSNESIAYTYGANHKVETETDGNGVTTSHAYDALRRLTGTTENVGTSTLSTTREYDRHDNLHKLNADGALVFQYDDFGNLVSEYMQESGTTTYTYDPAGNRLSETDANGRLVQYQYDAINRLVGVDAPGTADDIAYQYDTCPNGQGLLCSMTMESGVTTYAYDGLGRVTGHQEIGYAYDAAGRIRSIGYPSGAIVGYQYDAAGQVRSVDDTGGGAIAYGITYEPFGPVDGFTYGNGLSYSATYDAANRPTRQQTIGVLDRNYQAYDGNGNLKQLSETENGSTVSNLFDYDWANRLSAGSGAFGARDYAFVDPLNYSHDDRASHDEGAELLDYYYLGNRLYEIGVQTSYFGGGDGLPPQWFPGTSRYTGFDYDAAGNQTGKTVEIPDCTLISTPPEPDEYDCTIDVKDWVYDYSAYNQPVSVTLPDLQQAVYRYNALRQRVSKTLPGGVVTRYVYGLDGLLLAELDGLNNVLKEYVYLRGRLLAVRDFSGGAGRVYYAHNDHLGTPRLLTDVAARTVWRGDFDPFGKPAAIDEDPDGDGVNVSLNIRFPGQYYDAETGLHYNWNRYYDPETGRYTTPDPIGLEGGLNLYAYVGGNPVGFVDPIGLVKWRGTFEIASFSLPRKKMGFASYYEASFKLTADCVDSSGKRPTVTLEGSGYTVGPGIPLAKTAGDIVLDDYKDYVDAQGLNGELSYDSIGVTILGFDLLSRTNISIGDADSTYVDGAGLDASITINVEGEVNITSMTYNE